MKTTNAFGPVLLALTFAAFLASCQQGLLVKGKGSLAISEGSAARAISRNLYQWTDAVASYSAVGSGPGGASFSRDWAAGSSCTVDDLDAGAWTITLEGKDSLGATFKKGQASVTVLSGQTVSASVLLSFAPGQGSVSFSISWPPSVPVAAVEGGPLSDGTSSFPISFSISGQSTGTTVGTVPAGAGYRCQLYIKDASGNLVYGTTVTIHVTDGKNTPVNISLDPTQIGDRPATPAGFAAAPGLFRTELGWTASPGAIGYIVERKLRAETDYSILTDTCLSTGYSDLDVASLQTYDYRVSAYNAAYLESPQATASVTTADFTESMDRSRVSFGDEAMAAICPDGSVKIFGQRQYDAALSRSPLQYQGTKLQGLERIVAVDFGSTFFSLTALRDDGAVFDCRESIELSVTRLTAITRPVIAISRAEHHGLAIDADGALWVWGSNSDGVFGDGTTDSTNGNIPRKVPGLPPVKSVFAGGRHSLAVSTDGRVFAWGENYDGQLGLGDTASRLSPVEVPGISGARLVRANDALNGPYSSFVVLDSGAVLACGGNNTGQLGLAGGGRTSFTSVPGLSGIVDLQICGTATLAITGSGQVLGVGRGDQGILGSAAIAGTVYTSPLTLALPAASALYGASGKAIAMCGSASSPTWYGWGKRLYGELGEGAGSIVPLPESVASPAHFTSISSGDSHSLAIDDNGDVWAWGKIGSALVGDGSHSATGTPKKIPAFGSKAVQVAAAYGQSAVVLEDGSLYLWSGEGAPALFGSISNVKQVALGNTFYLALKNDGSVWAWGNNYVGLGDGVSTYSAAPVQVKNSGGAGVISGALAVQAGKNHGAVLLSDKSVAAWGQGTFGQLGNGSSSDSNLPVSVAGLANAKLISAHENGCLALLENGEIWAWGQILGGTWESTPYLLSTRYGGSLAGTVSMSMNCDYSFGVIGLRNAAGAICLYGNDSQSQLGDGWVDYDHDTSQPLSSSNVELLSIGKGWAVAQDASGHLWGWGDNSEGQLGLGRIQASYTSTPSPLTTF